MLYKFKQKPTDVLDSKLTANPNFAKLVRSIIFKVFSVETEYRTIYIDLNSCLSILFHYDNINEQILNDEIYKIIEHFISKYTAKGTKLVFLWTLKNSVLHTEIYDKWCAYRIERVNILKSTFIKKLIIGLTHFSQNNSEIIKIINTFEVHPAVIIKYIEMNNSNLGDINSKFLILSKDTVFRALDNQRGVLWTGKDYIDPTDRYKPLPNGITLHHNDKLLKYYLALKGDLRNEYMGIDGYGVKSSLRYIQKHSLELLSDLPLVIAEDEDNLNDVLQKFSKLWDMKYLFDESIKRFNLNKIIYPNTQGGS